MHPIRFCRTKPLNQVCVQTSRILSTRYHTQKGMLYTAVGKRKPSNVHDPLMPRLSSGVPGSAQDLGTPIVMGSKVPGTSNDKSTLNALHLNNTKQKQEQSQQSLSPRITVIKNVPDRSHEPECVHHLVCHSTGFCHCMWTCHVRTTHQTPTPLHEKRPKGKSGVAGGAVW